MKTTEEIMEHIGNILIELRKDPTKEFVPAVLRHLLLQIKAAAKAERDQELSSQLPKPFDNRELSGTALLARESFNDCLSQVKALLSPNNKEDE